jgi:hypothetical protein
VDVGDGTVMGLERWRKAGKFFVELVNVFF